MITTVQESDAPSPTLSIPLLLHVVLAALALNCLAWFFYANSNSEPFYLAHPRFEPWLWNLYLTTFLASLVGIFALWSFHQWGFWLLVVLTVLMVGIEVYAMGFTLRTPLYPAGVAAIWFAVQPVWKSLK